MQVSWKFTCDEIWKKSSCWPAVERGDARKTVTKRRMEVFMIQQGQAHKWVQLNDWTFMRPTCMFGTSPTSLIFLGPPFSIYKVCLIENNPVVNMPALISSSMSRDLSRSNINPPTSVPIFRLWSCSLNGRQVKHPETLSQIFFLSSLCCLLTRPNNLPLKWFLKEEASSKISVHTMGFTRTFRQWPFCRKTKVLSAK